MSSFSEWVPLPVECLPEFRFYLIFQKHLYPWDTCCQVSFGSLWPVIDALWVCHGCQIHWWSPCCHGSEDENKRDYLNYEIRFACYDIRILVLCNPCPLLIAHIKYWYFNSEQTSFGCLITVSSRQTIRLTCFMTLANVSSLLPGL